jgi:HD-GYP domain-containing protein (c-di-GMP phosphodiesterase class II)
MVADVFDALTSDRVYRKAWPAERVFTYIRQYAGQRFDPHIAALFDRPEVRQALLFIRTHDEQAAPRNGARAIRMAESGVARA